MLSQRTTPLLFVLLLVGAGSLAGQRSLYQDALELAKPAQKEAAISGPLILQFKPADATNSKLKVFEVESFEFDDDGNFIDIDATSFHPLDSPLDFHYLNTGYFGLFIFNASVGDSVTVRYGPITTTVDLSILQSPNDTTIGVREVMPLFSVERVLPDDGYVFKSLLIRSKLYSHRSYQTTILKHDLIPLNDMAVAKLAKGFMTLGQTVQLKEEQRIEKMKMGDIKRSFSVNPFIDIEEVLPELKGRDTFQLSDIGEDVSSEYNLYSAFPYLSILNGDSTLTDNGLSVGIDDISSYRQRIVTAQNRLDNANAAFERQRKKGGLLDVNTVAVGLSDFIAERAQEELNLTFFNRFKENLAKDSELTVLFPATHELLEKFEISNYKVFLVHARTAFNTDLDNLGSNISGILDLPNYERFKNDPNVFNLALIYDIANAAYQEKTVEEIILNTHQRLLDRQQNLSESINQAIADSLYLGRSPDEIPDFPFREEIRQYFRELDDLSRNLNKSVAALSEPTGDSIFAAFANQVGAPPSLLERPGFTTPKRTGSNLGNNGVGKDSKANNLRLVQELVKAARQLTDAPDYGPKKVLYHGERIETPYVVHEINFINAYLEGHELYSYYLLKNTSLTRERLQQVPQEEPTSYLAKGLDRSQKFLDIPFEELARKHCNTVKNVKKELQKKQEEAFDSLHIDFILPLRFYFINGRFHLMRQMSLKLETLQRAVGRPVSTDRYLMALALLLNEVKTAPYGDELAVNGEYLTKTSMIDGSNRVFDRLEEEWKDLMEAALSYHGERTSKVAVPQHNPDYVYNENWDSLTFLNDYFYYHSGKISEETVAKEISDYYLFSTDNPRGLSVREVLVSTKAEMDKYRAARVFIYDQHAKARISNFEGVDALLQKNEEQIQAFGETRKRLRRRLDSLKAVTVPNLVKARSNAKALASAIELSAHALFAFRDYGQLYDTLYFLDTQRVEITVQNTDLETGKVHTFKKDSFLVKQTPVPGTTDPIPVAQWITRQQFDELRRTPQTWNIFLGLLYQRLNQVKDVPPFPPRSVATLATQFLTIANEIQESQDKLRFKKGTNTDKVGVKEYFPFIRSTVDLLNIVLTTPIIGDSVTIAKRANALGKITEISNETLSLYENIDVREYGNAILNATELLRIITDRQYTQEEFDAMGKAERKRRAKTQRQVAAIFKYGTFMAEMINAKSSDQVKNILKSTTLPPGSSRIKREVQSNITINSYLGAGLGRDRLLDAPADLDADAFGAALSVPIGLTYSFSPKFLRNRSSFSVHVPLLDLGAITAYRSNPNGQTANVNALPELEWKNLFSPGAYLIYNFADSPFSLGIGGQYGPQLRELNQANGEPIFLNSFRFPMISATIDVPFYNLHTGPRKMVVK